MVISGAASSSTFLPACCSLDRDHGEHYLCYFYGFVQLISNRLFLSRISKQRCMFEG